MFFIHGGSFTEGDGQNGFYGPDQIIENDVILVTGCTIIFISKKSCKKYGNQMIKIYVI